MLLTNLKVIDDRDHKRTVRRDTQIINFVFLNFLDFFFHIVKSKLRHLALDSTDDASAQHIPNEDMGWVALVRFCLVNVEETRFVGGELDDVTVQFLPLNELAHVWVQIQLDHGPVKRLVIMVFEIVLIRQNSIVLSIRFHTEEAFRH